MALNAREYKQESKFERPPALDAGSYPARVVQIISLGLQKQRPYKGVEKAPKDELYVTYELADEFMLDENGDEVEDKPRWISERFTMNSLDSDLAKSTKRYYALDPNEKYDGDWSMLAGAPCTVILSRDKSKKDGDDTIYNNVTGLSTMRDKEVKKLPDLVNEPKIFDIDSPDMEIFGSLPEWLQKVIKENLNFEGSKLQKLLGDEPSKDEEEEPEGNDEDNEKEDW